MRKLLAGQKIGLILSGLAAFFILLEISLRLSGAIFFLVQDHRNKKPAKQLGSYAIMCLGESTTGFGGKYSWPAQLQEILNQNSRQKEFKFRVVNKGIPGANSGLILSQLENNLDFYNPDMVVAMLGINDGRFALEYDAALVKQRAAWLQELKIYKLIRLIWLNIVNKKGMFLSGRQDKNSQNCREAERIFKEKIAVIPNDDSAYLKLGDCYLKHARYQEAEKMFKKAIQVNPANSDSYRVLGNFYLQLYRFQETESRLKKAIKIDPGDDCTRAILGHIYNDGSRLEEAENILQQATAINPHNDYAYLGLGNCYFKQARYADAERMFKKAIEIAPDYDEHYRLLGNFYLQKPHSGGPDMVSEAQAMLEKAIAVNPENSLAYVGLGDCYNRKAQYVKAEAALKKALALSPNESWAYLELEKCYRMQGREEENAVLYRQYVQNYRAIKKILDRRRVKLVCVQYPMRSLKPLEAIFQSETGILFVDNEKIFKDALRHAAYEAYFEDNFAGDFGHATKKGNRLLAENIASAILKEFITGSQGESWNESDGKN